MSIEQIFLQKEVVVKIIARPWTCSCARFLLCDYTLQILLRNNRYSLKTAHARYMSIKIVNFLVLGQIVQLLGQSDLNIKPLFFLIFMFSDELEPLLIP